METIVKQQNARKFIRVHQDHHAALLRRKVETGRQLESLLDEALELGMRMKRWLPDPAEETATA